MAISFKLEQKQTQKLKLSLNMRHSLELLQLSTVELSDRIAKELEKNPVLTEKEFGERNIKSTDKNFENISKQLNGAEIFKNDNETLRNSQIDLSNSISSYRTVEDNLKNMMFENSIYQKESLSEHLLSQAKIISKNDREYFLYESIISSLDERGFFITSRNELMLNEINFFEPVGCAVDNFLESLKIQALFFYPKDKVLFKILDNFFIYIEKMDYNYISEMLGISKELVLEKTKIIQTLNPFPGRQYSQANTKFIIPDLTVYLLDNNIIVNLNDDFLPEIKIDRYYENIFLEKNLQKQQKDYLKEKISSAKNFIRNIQMRKNTILNVTSCIMDYQKMFFENGPGSLRPLTQKKIAEDLDIHESTVSRAIAGKYVQTSMGIFELKYFFVSKIKNLQGGKNEIFSSDQIKNKLQNLLGNENRQKPLTDDEMVNLLAQENIKIARRTIAKYRGMLDIPPSNKRKKLYKIH